jgi:hypothetical protein
MANETKLNTEEASETVLTGLGHRSHSDCQSAWVPKRTRNIFGHRHK